MIEINNLTSNPVKEKFLKRVVKRIIKEEFASWQKRELNLSIALVDSERIRKLNKKYLGKNRVTDILAFPNQVSKKEKFISPPRKIKELGEILICLREVKKNAERFDLPYEKELARVLIHGILHLLGYDHEKSKAGAKKMGKKQKYYLSLIK